MGWFKRTFGKRKGGSRIGNAIRKKVDALTLGLFTEEIYGIAPPEQQENNFDSGHSGKILPDDFGS